MMLRNRINPICSIFGGLKSRQSREGYSITKSTFIVRLVDSPILFGLTTLGSYIQKDGWMRHGEIST